MLTRCPGCAKQIPETADICPHCKRDFRTPLARQAPKPAEPEKPAPARRDEPSEKRPEPESKPHLVTRCPGCAREIDEAAEICPYCKRDFRPASKKPAPKPAEPPSRKEEPGRKEPEPLNPDLPKTMIISSPQPSEAKKAAAGAKAEDKPPEPAKAELKAPEPKPEAKAPGPKAAEPKAEPHKEAEPKKDEDRHKDSDHLVMLMRCPGCAKPISETVEVCPHCKRDFRTAAEKAGVHESKPPKNGAPAKAGGAKELDLPRHMMADLDAAPRSLDAEAARVLPPHMLESATAEFKTQPDPPKKGSAVLFAIVGAIILGAVLRPLLLKKPDAQQAVVQTPEPAPPPANPNPPQTAQKPPEAPAAAKPPEPQPAVVEPPKPEPIVEKKSRRKGGKKKQAEKQAEEASTTAPVEQASAAKRPAKWHVQGKVFDLVTLKSVSDVDIVFADPSGQSVRTVSGADGSYRATLPASSRGYEIRVSQDDYLPKAIADPDPSFRSMSEDSRKEQAKKFTQFSPTNPPLLPKGDDQLRQDFAMIAREKHGKTLEEALQDSK